MITIDWATKIISVPKSFMTQVQTVPYEIRELDADTFRFALKDLEDDIDGMPFLDTHRHTAGTSIGGVNIAKIVEIINGYTITFEDDIYAVSIVGANTNILDSTNLNSVSVRSANSVGLVDNDADNRILEMWTKDGLDKNNPFTHTPTRFYDQDGKIDQDVTGDGETSTTVTRN
jgi:hypothetical protein